MLYRRGPTLEPYPFRFSISTTNFDFLSFGSFDPFENRLSRRASQDTPRKQLPTSLRNLKGAAFPEPLQRLHPILYHRKRPSRIQQARRALSPLYIKGSLDTARGTTSEAGDPPLHSIRETKAGGRESGTNDSCKSNHKGPFLSFRFFSLRRCCWHWMRARLPAFPAGQAHMLPTFRDQGGQDWGTLVML